MTSRQYYIKHTDHHRSQMTASYKKQNQKLLHNIKCSVSPFIL